MIHPLKITSTLADDTRFSIYQYMLQEKETFTVQKIADQFGIHPNVARLHLTKLTEIDVISSEFEKTGKGGRPGRIYRASENGVSLSFPKRNYEELLGLVLEILVELGPDSIAMGKKVCYRRGQSDILSIVRDHGTSVNSLSYDDKIAIITEASTLIGYVPVVTDLENGQRSIHFAVYNCPYHNEIAEYANLVCSLHESYLKGQFDCLFNVDDFMQIESMTDGCKYCSYNVSTK
ncbi:helix-turn-helix transcriptional regulator [Kurthia sibirica]|uniref:Transcriptional regulator n=1 Tax=Kurthia sibirica TaxID=202750 RepID=A0A2U3ALX3_9BACL|nr:helix-turn-helix domain-containing protein [Kurthia sibirica]PWI25538.1 transcriptional regulator [Kurthia sibirica]GEK33914.1 transcriptional regulator [Kurthia sibirica]